MPRKKPADQILWALGMGIVLLISLFCGQVQAQQELFFRTGVLTGTFQGKGVTNGTFTSDVSLQVELFKYDSSRQASVLRALLSNESGLGQTRYFGVGGGQRFFFTDALSGDLQASDTFVSIQPTWSFYYGWDVNLAQFLVLPLSDTLATYATMVDIGGSVGARRMLGKNYSIDAMVGYSFGYSISSSVSVTASIIRAFVGIGYSF
jgi:hypothetical protein